MDMHPENAWVAARLAALTPDLEPEPRARPSRHRPCDHAAEAAPAYRLAAAAAAALFAAVRSRRPAARWRRISGTACS